MASLSNLTDEELRNELKAYGVNAAVTSSTRNILLKKLNHLISGSEKSSKASIAKGGKRASNSANSPSGDTVNIKEGKTVQKGRVSYNRNKTKEQSQPILPLRRSALSNFSSDEDATEPEETYEPSMSNSRPRRSLRNSGASTSTLNSHNKSQFLSSDNESVNSSPFVKKSMPIVRKKSKSSFLSSHLTKYTNSSHELLNNKSRSYDPDQYDTGSDSDLNSLDDTDTIKRSTGFLLMDRLSGRTNNLYSGDNNLKKNLQTNNNYNFGARISNSFRSDFSNGSDDPREEVEITSLDDVVSGESFVPSHLANGQYSLNQIAKSRKAKSSWDPKLWLPSIPFILLILLASFFCILGFCYIGINAPIISNAVLPSLNFGHWIPFVMNFFARNVTSNHRQEIGGAVPAELTNSKFPICKNNDNIKLSCLSIEEALEVPDLLSMLEKTIFPRLLRQAKSYQCGESNHHYLDTESIAAIVKDVNFSKSLSEVISGLNGLGKLALLHPKLGLEPVWNNVETPSPPSLRGLAFKNPPKEILCLLIAAFHNFVYYFLGLLLVLVAVWMSLKLYRYRKRIREEHEQKSFELVEQILEILENSCGTESPEFMAVNHVRDALISPRERKAQADYWRRAVTFIDDHDSRVYREVRSVGGEDTEVWRWVSGAPKTPPEKIWQGQAFESLESSPTVPQVSPTSCLKIRNMFDSDIEFGDHWPRRIQDSLLEKCEGIDILHVAVDRMSKEGCVYIKCANTREAGKAFRSLHGWWFDGNLVTVKYLRDERYQERFPVADNANSPLKPSNNERLSLQKESEFADKSELSSNKKRTAQRFSTRKTKS